VSLTKSHNVKSRGAKSGKLGGHMVTAVSVIVFKEVVDIPKEICAKQESPLSFL
jgi:hypothetical protein